MGQLMVTRAEELVLQFHERALTLARYHYRRLAYRVPLDDLESECLYALVICADRWEEYCGKHGYDATLSEWFWTYAARRITGAVLDMGRDSDIVTRKMRTTLKESGTEVAKVPDYLLRQPRDISAEHWAALAGDTSTPEEASVSLAAGAAAKMYLSLPERHCVSLAVREAGLAGKLFKPPELSRQQLHRAAAVEIRDAVLGVIGDDREAPEPAGLSRWDKRKATPGDTFTAWLSWTDQTVDGLIVDYASQIQSDANVLVEIINLIGRYR